MLNNFIIFIEFICVVIADKSSLLWNIEKPYKYSGFIYTDSNIVVINPALQIKISNNEEICNFYVNESDSVSGRSQPFRAVVKSAHLGLADLELKPHWSLETWRDKVITITVAAESCHDPDAWSEPATVLIKVVDPPGPIWSKRSYRVNLDNNAPPGTTLVIVRAYVPNRASPDNGICQYSIRMPVLSPFQIDGQGVITTTKPLTITDSQQWTLVVVAKDCSQPVQRESSVKVSVMVSTSCTFGWSGIPVSLRYKPGTGVKYIAEKVGFHLCNNEAPGDSRQGMDAIMSRCMSNNTLRLTTSVELKSSSSSSVDRNECKFDSQSLRLQRTVCGVPGSSTLDLLWEMHYQRAGAIGFPSDRSIFPSTSIKMCKKLSLYFWMKRTEVIGSTEQYVISEIDDLGNNIFSVSLRRCVLRIKMMSYKSRFDQDDETQSCPSMWVFTLPQLCDDKWHHVLIRASRVSEATLEGKLSLYLDGELIEFKRDNPEILLSSPLPFQAANMTDIFIGQCPSTKNTEFKGLLAGVVLAPGVLLKATTARCLTKCSERLYFIGMNQMNPGMSVSLNSEMQMIIINGHSIEEVVSLVKVIGFVNPTWNPSPGPREVTIETEMSCGTRLFSVPTVRVHINIEPQQVNATDNQVVALINLASTVTTIIIPDSAQTNSDTGTGVAMFANTSLEIISTPLSIRSPRYEVSGTISKCVMTMHPRLNPGEYVDWPRHLLEAVVTDRYSIKVTNNSRTLTLYGAHNQQVYQFVIQHLRYFSGPPQQYVARATRTFQLQCLADSDTYVVKSNYALVKVTIWYNNEDNKPQTTTLRPPLEDTSSDYISLWKDIIDNITFVRNNEPGHAHSNAAIISESDSFPKKTNNILYNILLGVGLLTLVFVLIMLIGKYRRHQVEEGCVVPFRVVDRICFPLQIIKEKIRPSPSVRVELSRDFINCISERRRDISMEMQWDDTELKSNSGFNIIANPMYETSIGDIDDIVLNKDVPPTCYEEDSTSDDDIYEDFSDIYLNRSRSIEKVKVT